MHSPELGGGKLIKFCLFNNSVDATAFLLTDAHTPHKICKALVTRLIAIDEPSNWHNGFARIGNLQPVYIDFNHGTGTLHGHVLVDQRVGNKLANAFHRQQFHLSAKRVFDDFVLRQLSHNEINEPLESNSVATSAELIEACSGFANAGIDDNPRSFARKVRKRFQLLGK